MRKVMKNESGKRYSFGTIEDGLLVDGFCLYDRDGMRMGEATITLDRIRRQLILQIMLTPMDAPAIGYGCRWTGFDGTGYVGFLLDLPVDYIAARLAEGHDEARVFRADLTREKIKELYPWSEGDADWAGAALVDLEECGSTSGFFGWADRFDIEDVYKYFVTGFGEQVGMLHDRLIPALRLALTKEAETA